MSFDGLMNQELHWMSRTVASDTIGGAVETWTYEDIFIPCRVVALSGTERAMIGSRGVDITHRIFCRPKDELNEKDRLEGDAIYQIEFVNNVDAMGHHMELLCREIRDGGGIGD